MPEFPKPHFADTYDVATEKRALRKHRRTRGIPGKNAQQSSGRYLEHRAFRRAGPSRPRSRTAGRYPELVRPGGDTGDPRELRSPVPRAHVHGRSIHDDLLRRRWEQRAHGLRVRLLEEVGEVNFPPSQLKRIVHDNIADKFQGFDWSPYVASFEIGRSSFLLINVHLYFGSTKKASMDRRALETYAVAVYAAQRRKAKYAFTREVIALGDFNMPKRDSTDRIYRALRARGLELPEHSTAIGSNLASDKHYDQVAFFPGETKNCFTGNAGVFDFDGVIFEDLWETRGKKDFDAYLRYYISDHRPLWMELAIP